MWYILLIKYAVFFSVLCGHETWIFTLMSLDLLQAHGWAERTNLSGPSCCVDLVITREVGGSQEGLSDNLRTLQRVKSLYIKQIQRVEEPSDRDEWMIRTKEKNKREDSLWEWVQNIFNYNCNHNHKGRWEIVK